MMFTAYAIDLDSREDTKVKAQTLDEAISHLRELVQSEIDDPAGPRFDRYGISIDRDALKQEWNDDSNFDAFGTSEWLIKKHEIDPVKLLGTLVMTLTEEFRNLLDELAPRYDKEGEDEAEYERRYLAANAEAARQCVLSRLVRLFDAKHRETQVAVLDDHNNDFGAGHLADIRREAKELGMLTVLFKQAVQGVRSEYTGLDPESAADDDNGGEE